MPLYTEVRHMELLVVRARSIEIPENAVNTGYCLTQP